MSRLTDKVSSYTHFKGISFDEATYTGTPTQTGSKSPFNYMADTLFGTTNPQYISVVPGPMPGQNAYQFEFDFNNGKAARLYYGSFTASNAGSGTDIRRTFWDGTPFDRVWGFWFKTPKDYYVPSGFGFGIHRILNGNSPIVGLYMGLENGKPRLSMLSVAEINSTWFADTKYGNSTDGYKDFEQDKWYFFAVRKEMSFTNTPSANETAYGTLKYTLYVNGIESASISNDTWTLKSVSAIEWGRPGAGGTDFKFNLTFANWFIADWSDIGQQGLKDIYLYGSPTNRDFQNADIKYYDGSTWNSSSNEKVYHSGAWQDVFASRYDGTNWLPI